MVFDVVYIDHKWRCSAYFNDALIVPDEDAGEISLSVIYECVADNELTRIIDVKIPIDFSIWDNQREHVLKDRLGDNYGI